MKKILIFLFSIVTLSVSGQINWNQIEYAAGADYIPLSDANGVGVWTELSSIDLSEFSGLLWELSRSTGHIENIQAEGTTVEITNELIVNGDVTFNDDSGNNFIVNIPTQFHDNVNLLGSLRANGALPTGANLVLKSISAGGITKWGYIDWSELTGIPSDILDGDDVNDADFDPTNEFQDLTIADNVLSLTDSSVNVDLLGYLDNTDSQTLTWNNGTNNLAISGGNDVTITGFLETEVDGDITNELQDLTLSGNTLSLTDSSVDIDLSSFTGHWTKTGDNIENNNIGDVVVNSNFISESAAEFQDNVNMNALPTTGTLDRLLGIEADGDVIEVDPATITGYWDLVGSDIENNNVGGVFVTGDLTVEDDAFFEGTSVEIENSLLSQGDVQFSGLALTGTLDKIVGMDSGNNLFEVNPSIFDGHWTLSGSNIENTNTGSVNILNNAIVSGTVEAQNVYAFSEIYSEGELIIEGGTEFQGTVEANGLPATGTLDKLVGLESGGNMFKVDASTYLDNTDSQDLTWNNGTNTIEISGGTNAVITGFLETEVDGSITNELQDLSNTRVGNQVTIEITDGTNTTFTDNYEANTDTQLTGDQVKDYAGEMVLTGVESNISVTYDDINHRFNFVVDDDLSNYDNSTSSFLTTEVDGVIGNEYQDFDVATLVGTNLQLSLTNDGVATEIIDLSSLQDGTGTDSQNLTWNGGTNTIQISNGTNAVITGFLETDDLIWGLNGTTAFYEDNVSIGADTDTTFPLYIESGTTKNASHTPTYDDIVINGGNYSGMTIYGTLGNSIYFKDDGIGTANGYLTYSHANNRMTIGVSGSNEFRVKSGGEIQMFDYGVGNRSGTYDYLLGVDSDGDIQDVPLTDFDLSISGNTLSLLAGGATVDLSTYLDNTDTQLTETQVDNFVANNGYLSTEVDGVIGNEYQDLSNSRSGNDVTIEINNGTNTTFTDNYEANTDAQTLSFNTSTNILTVSGGNTADLSTLAGGSAVWSETGTTAYYEDNVVIGTNTASTYPLLISSGSTKNNSPTYDDIIIDGGTYAGISIYSTLANSINFYDNTSGSSVGYLTYSHSSDHMTIGVGGTNELRVKNSGEVQFLDYGVGSRTGTAAYMLAVDTDGDILDYPLSDFDLSFNTSTNILSNGFNTVDLSTLDGGSSDTDWVEGSGVVYNSSDDIGMGITIPDGKVHIVGASERELIIEASIGSPDIVFMADDNERGQIVYNDFNDGFTIRVNNDGTGLLGVADDIMFIGGATENRVGINTVTPERTFHVDGFMRFTGQNTGTVNKLLGTESDGDVIELDAPSLTFNTSTNILGNGFNTIDLSELDNSGTDSQDLTWNSSTNILGITGGNTVDLSILDGGGGDGDGIYDGDGSVDASTTVTLNSPLKFENSTGYFNFSSTNNFFTMERSGDYLSLSINSTNAKMTTTNTDLVITDGSHDFLEFNIGTDDITFNESYTFPNTDGSANQVLQTDGSGNVDWATVSSGGDTDWTEGTGVVYNTADDIGIGTVTPSHKFEVETNDDQIAEFDGQYGKFIINQYGQLLQRDDDYPSITPEYWTQASRDDGYFSIAYGTLEALDFINSSKDVFRVYQDDAISIYSSETGTHDYGDVYGRLYFETDDTNGSLVNKRHAWIQSAHLRSGTGHTAADAGLQFVTTNDDAWGGEVRMTIANNGDIGIGTVTPASKIHIVGTSQLDFALEATAGNIDQTYVENGNSRAQIKYHVSNNGLQFLVDDAHTGITSPSGTTATVLHLDGDGTNNVGINTVDPKERLHVYDADAFVTMLVERGDGSFAKLGAGGSNSFFIFDNDGDFVFQTQDDVDIEGNSNRTTIGTIYGNGDAKFTGSLNLSSGTQTVDGTIRYDGTNFQGRHSGSWVNLDASGGSSLFTDGGATTYLTATTDNLSIGGTTTLIGEKLNVTGSMLASDRVYVGNGSSVYFTQNGNDLVLYNGSSVGDAKIDNVDLIIDDGGIRLTTYKDAGEEGAVQYLSGTGLQVHDGTSWSTLSDGDGIYGGDGSIDSETNVTLNSDINFLGTGTGAGDEIQFSSNGIFYHTDGTVNYRGLISSSFYALGTTSNHDLRIEANNSFHTVFENSGDMGIGVTVANEKLHVDGAILISDTGAGSNNGTIKYDSTNDEFQFREDGAWVGLGGSGDGDGIYSGSGSTTFATPTIIDIGNSLVIEGTTGDISFVNDLATLTFETGTVSGEIHADLDHMYIGTTNAQELKLIADDEEVLEINRNGNVDIVSDGAMILSRLTTTERNALTAVNGMMIYNTTTNKFQGYENGSWVDLN